MTKLKLHNIHVIPKLVKKVIANADLSKASGCNCILLEILRKSELFNMLLKESCFPDFWKVSSLVPVFKNAEGRLMAKNYCPVSLLSVVSKVFEKLVNDRLIDHFEKCGL